MLVIIPNPNQMLQLVQVQKKFIKQNESGIIFYQNSPLWIPVFESDFPAKTWKKDELKQFLAELTSITIETPFLRTSQDSHPVSLSSQVDMIIGSKQQTSFLKLCNSIQSSCQQIPPQKIKGSQEMFPMSLKVFRAANAEQQSSNSFAITDFVWKKIR